MAAHQILSLSIVIPAFNEEERLPETLQFFAHGTFQIAEMKE